MSTQLYRHFDGDGNLLYVGISLSAIARLGQHKTSHWFNQIATVTIEKFDSRDDALDAEFLAIKTENPLHNRSGKVKRKPQRAYGQHSVDGVTIRYSKAAWEAFTEEERAEVLDGRA